MKKLISLISVLGFALLMSACQTGNGNGVATGNVRSSAIKNLGYNDGSLVVTFENKDVYLFSDVPEQTYLDFKASPSKGIFFNQKVNGQFPYTQVK